MKKERVKKVSKMIKRIKWENVFLIIDFMFNVLSIRHHILLNGFYPLLGLEIAMYLSFGLIIRYIIKDMRKNPKKWLF